ncbi:MAG: hypothetical protein JNL11_13870 [Bdellovibrionaceae bacterium]|nr:hypothetical protein [Pseudobdellovibrionaceae bacterium]
MKWILFFVMLTMQSLAMADEISIFEVRRNIPLSDTDPIYKDFYIKGDNGKLKKNQTYTVTRKVTMQDASGSQVMGEVQAPVGQLKIIAVYGKIAVAREVKLFSREDLPMLDNPWFMIGDSLESN